MNIQNGHLYRAFLQQNSEAIIEAFRKPSPDCIKMAESNK